VLHLVYVHAIPLSSVLLTKYNALFKIVAEGYMKSEGYTAHKNRQLEKILKAAEKLFIEKGIKGTTVGDIAHESGIDRSTLYRYFPNEVEIAWAIENKNMERVFDIDHAYKSAVDMDGFQLLNKYLHEWLEFMKANLSFFKFSAELDYYYSRDKTLMEIKSHFNKMPEPMTEIGLTAILEKGKNDGTIRQDIDAKQTALSICNAMISAVERVAARGNLLLESEYYDPVGFIDTLVKILLNGLKPE
jgi:TetR/AcrR family transcriptional regulator, cholesterol catabolism regulator